MALRIGAVSYLNTKPLIYRLRQQLVDCELILDLPSRLAARLMDRQLDVALIPSVEYFRGGSELAFISNACIACRGPVRSVQLLFRKRPDLVKTLALDEGSRTSAVLAQILLSERFNVRPQKMVLPIDEDFGTCEADAILVIGDRAMKIDAQSYFQTWDLGEHWNRWSQLPFVFAMWVTRSAELDRPEIKLAAEALERCRDAGLNHLTQIAEEHAWNYGLTVQDCLVYFAEQLHFVLGDQEREGLDLFHRLAQKLGLLACHGDDEVDLGLDSVVNCN